MAEFVRIDRRIFLARLGRGALALAVIGACGESVSATTLAASTTSSATTTAATSASTTPAAASTASPAGPTSQFLRADLGFVAAYAVVRGAEAAIVDTGVAGSEAAIEAALGSIDLGWDAVGHVILTHHHPDHVGSLSAVMDSATSAIGYVGEEDFDNVSGPRELIAVAEGDQIFGLDVIATPGHTAGHISLFDASASVFIVGDALNGANGGVEGPNPQFSEDHDQALATVGKIAGYTFETLYFGHGEPVMTGASEMVAALTEGL